MLMNNWDPLYEGGRDTFSYFCFADATSAFHCAVVKTFTATHGLTIVK